MAGTATTARCRMCGHQVSALLLRSPLGRQVTAIFCPWCDIAKPPKR